MSKRGVCKKCGDTDNYNFAINNGLCNGCIDKRLGQLEADLLIYGRHLKRCEVTVDKQAEGISCVPIICTCGYEEAIKE